MTFTPNKIWGSTYIYTRRRMAKILGVLLTPPNPLPSDVVTFCTARGDRQNAAPGLKISIWDPTNQVCSQTTLIGAVKILGGNLLN